MNSKKYAYKTIMEDTNFRCLSDKNLVESISSSVKNAEVVYEKDKIEHDFDLSGTKNIVFSSDGSFTAASKYKNKKVAVLDFANAKYPGGPSHGLSNSQEASLCRTSTLLPCLYEFKDSYYEKHFSNDFLGNDDLIYVPNVIVFKDDQDFQLLNENQFKTDVIVSCAPYLRDNYISNDRLKPILYKRLEKVMQIAQKKGVEVLILGAYGCGKFHNEPVVVATAFKELLEKYHFDTVEFAIYSDNDNTKLLTFQLAFK